MAGRFALQRGRREKTVGGGGRGAGQKHGLQRPHLLHRTDTTRMAMKPDRHTRARRLTSREFSRATARPPRVHVGHPQGADAALPQAVMGHLTGLVPTEILGLGQLRPKLRPHAQHRQGHPDDSQKEGKLDLPLQAVAHLVGPPVAPSPFHSTKTPSLARPWDANLTLLILLHEEIRPHALPNRPEPEKEKKKSNVEGTLDDRWQQQQRKIRVVRVKI